MLGAIAGDIIGSVYEWRSIKTKRFPLFQEKSVLTDDTILTVAVAEKILEGGNYTDLLRQYGRRYPKAGYGGRFIKWMHSESKEPYNSYGNGSAMRVSPVGWAFDSLEETLNEAKTSAEATHNHPHGIRGAQATAAAIWMARKREKKGSSLFSVGNHPGI